MTCYDDKNDKRMININIDRIFSIGVALKRPAALEEIIFSLKYIAFLLPSLVIALILCYDKNCKQTVKI